MKKYYTVKAFGVETSVPRWVLTPMALILLAGLAFVTYQKTYADPERALISLRDANRQLAAEVEEYGLHAMENPEKHELLQDQDGQLVLRVFKDHCVLIQRSTRRGVRTKLVVDLARAASLGSSRQVDPPPSSGIFPVVHASEQDPCRRGCLNPHPGAFRWWYGERRGEWVEVWRQWPEGCTHVQMLNPRVGAWDTNQDGTPRVRWTCCVH